MGRLTEGADGGSEETSVRGSNTHENLHMSGMLEARAGCLAGQATGDRREASALMMRCEIRRMSGLANRSALGHTNGIRS
jgi:hypothetical protein